MARTAAAAAAVAVVVALMLVQNSLQDKPGASLSQDCSSELKKLKHLVDQQGLALTELKQNVKKITETAGKQKVAFSAALGLPAGLRGPFSSEITIVYKNVLTNVGNAYNSATGIFTAPYAGVYYVRFTGSVYDNNIFNMGVNLYKNGQFLMHLGENSIDGLAKHVSSGVTVQLVSGDQIYTRLPINYVLWDDAYFRTSFSGFFLFPM